MLIIDGFPTSQQLVSFRVGSEEKEGGGGRVRRRRRRRKREDETRTTKIDEKKKSGDLSVIVIGEEAKCIERWRKEKKN